MNDVAVSSLSREPDEQKDVIVVCKAVHELSRDPSAPYRDVRTEYTVWIGVQCEEYPDREGALARGQQLAEEHQRRLWLHDGDYPPKLMWPLDPAADS